MNVISGAPPTLLISLRAFSGGGFDGRKKSEQMQHFPQSGRRFWPTTREEGGGGYKQNILCSFSNWKVDSCGKNLETVGKS